MTFPNAKEIKKLAAACRAAGISHFKCGDFEFSLGDLPEPKPAKTAKTQAASVQDEPDTGEMLSEEALLFWSAGVETTEGDLQ